MKRRVLLPNFALDRNSADALHRQLADAVRRAISNGELPAGAFLPSTRALADALGISRNTVVTAYDELTAEGLLMSRPGSATRVSQSAPLRRTPDWGMIVRRSQYPVDPLSFRDPDGNALYFHR